MTLLLIFSHFSWNYNIQRFYCVSASTIVSSSWPLNLLFDHDQAITTLNDLNDALDDEEEEYYYPRSIPMPLPHCNNDKGDDSDSSDELRQLFVTIFPYEPTASNELKLELADLIDVLKTSETGWWKGQCLRTQLDGWFPSSYVKVPWFFLSFILMPFDQINLKCIFHRNL